MSAAADSGKDNFCALSESHRMQYAQRISTYAWITLQCNAPRRAYVLWNLSCLHSGLAWSPFNIRSQDAIQRNPMDYSKPEDGGGCEFMRVIHTALTPIASTLAY